MAESDPIRRISALSDVDLVRLLTVDAGDQSEETLAAAEAEAVRRGVPIDPRFIPVDADESSPAPQGRSFAVQGHPIVCTQCGGKQFTSRRILLNTRGLTFLNLDWLNESATALICDRCSFIQLFARAPSAER